MKKRTFLLIAVLVMAGTLCACERQSTGAMKITGGKKQTVSEKVIDNNVEQIIENVPAMLPEKGDSGTMVRRNLHLMCATGLSGCWERYI